MALEVGVRQLAEARARPVDLFRLVRLHALAPRDDLGAGRLRGGLFSLGNRDEDLDAGLGRVLDARVLRMASSVFGSCPVVRLISESGNERPDKRFTSPTGKSMTLSGACASPATTMLDGVPPQRSSTSTSVLMST